MLFNKKDKIKIKKKTTIKATNLDFAQELKKQWKIQMRIIVVETEIFFGQPKGDSCFNQKIDNTDACAW